MTVASATAASREAATACCSERRGVGVSEVAAAVACAKHAPNARSATSAAYIAREDRTENMSETK